MTCIVGIIEKEKVFIGGDSAGASGLDVRIRKDPKVFKINDFAIGCTSSFRMIQLIRFSFKSPYIKKNQDVYEYMCTNFINALRKCFKDGGYIEIDRSRESGGTFLVGYKNRLFAIYDDFQVEELTDEFNCVGCGAKYAFGALRAMDKKLSATEKIKKALEIATYYSGGVRLPFIIEKT